MALNYIRNVRFLVALAVCQELPCCSARSRSGYRSDHDSAVAQLCQIMWLINSINYLLANFADAGELLQLLESLIFPFHLVSHCSDSPDSPEHKGLLLMQAISVPWP